MQLHLATQLSTDDQPQDHVFASLDGEFWLEINGLPTTEANYKQVVELFQPSEGGIPIKMATRYLRWQGVTDFTVKEF